MRIKHQPTSLFLQQFFDQESSTYTYLIADTSTSEAAIIDPVDEKAKLYLQHIQELGVKLVYILDTHVHADHVTAANKIKTATQAKIVSSVAYNLSCADIRLKDGDTIALGKYTIRAFATPGHTDGCQTYYVDGMAFTGDALLIRGCGRTDFQGGDPNRLYESITKKIFTLPDETRIYPAHDYNGRTVSTVLEEKLYNPRIGQQKSREEFITIMKNLNLKEPLKINIAVPANRDCGYLSDRQN